MQRGQRHPHRVLRHADQLQLAAADGPSYGQYATRIYDGYLFHSVPYYSQHKDDVEYDEFNKLGTVASLGCIRLAVVDVKWIYDNCPLGTPVVIYNDKDPGPMGKPRHDLHRP